MDRDKTGDKNEENKKRRRTGDEKLMYFATGAPLGFRPRRRCV